MSRTETLLRVKEAEESAKRIISEAEEEQKSVVASARKDAVKLIQDAESQIKTEADTVIADQRAKLATQREALLSEGRKQADVLEAQSGDRISKVKDHLIENFERAIDATS